MLKSPISLVFFLFLSLRCFPSPPLRIAIPAGAEGLETARVWAALTLEYTQQTQLSLESKIVSDNNHILYALHSKEAELAVMDTLFYVQNKTGLIILGIICAYGNIYEPFLLIAGEVSTIHRLEDLHAASLVLSRPDGLMGSLYPLLWARQKGYIPSKEEHIYYDEGYGGVLACVALGVYEAGFLPQGYLHSRSLGAMVTRVRVLEATEAYPLSLLVARDDLSDERLEAAQRLLSIGVDPLRIHKPPMDLYEVLRNLEEVTGVLGS